MELSVWLTNLAQQLTEETGHSWSKFRIFELTPAIYSRSFNSIGRDPSLRIFNEELQAPKAFAARFTEICRSFTWIHVEAVTSFGDSLVVMIEHSNDVASPKAQTHLAKDVPHVRIISNEGKWRAFELID